MVGLAIAIPTLRVQIYIHFMILVIGFMVPYCTSVLIIWAGITGQNAGYLSISMFSNAMAMFDSMPMFDNM